jgi:hypothetical protein
MLVHMAPEEVAGLQALALKHGGTLTINPETGLAEAGFLKSILPMIAGFALGPAGFGLSSAMAGLTVGGITALTSKSLEKGLMAGLGAYGGSGLGESLMGAGTNALSSAGANAVVPPAAESIVPQAVVPESLANVVPASSAGATAGMQPLAGVPGKFVTDALPQPAVPAIPTTTPTISPAELGGTGDFARFDRAYSAELGAQAGPSTGDFARFDRAYSPGLGASQTDKLGAGFNAVTASPSAALEFAKANKLPLAALGIAALSGSDDKNVPTLTSPGLIRPYTYSRTKVPGAFDRTPNDPMSSRERQYFNDQYTALTPYKAPGPEYMAVGGPVEDMSNGNDMAAYMGQDKFDRGGSVTGTVGGYTYNPRTGLYTKPGGQGATTVAPTGGLSGASGSSGGGDNSLNYVNPNVAKETFEEQSARNQKLNDFLTEVLPTVLSPFSTMARGLYDTPIAGGIANFFSPPGSMPNFSIPVDNTGTYAGMPAMGQTSYESGVGNPAEGGGGSNQESSGFTSGADPGGYGGGDLGSFLAGGGLTALAQGGIANLGDYSDGGRLLRGPGDGVSDSIPARIGAKQEARLADGEFVVPARIVSELGNGSTEAGARQLYAMMDRVQKARKKTVGKDKVATNSRAAKLLPA